MRNAWVVEQERILFLNVNIVSVREVKQVPSQISKKNSHAFSDCAKTSKKPRCAAGVTGLGRGRHFHPRSHFTPTINLRGHQILGRPPKMFQAI